MAPAILSTSISFLPMVKEIPFPPPQFGLVLTTPWCNRYRPHDRPQPLQLYSQVVKVRSPADGSLRPRDVRQLSGGERRRLALALCLGYGELARRRRRLVCNVIVLDEVRPLKAAGGCGTGDIGTGLTMLKQHSNSFLSIGTAVTSSG